MYSNRRNYPDSVTNNRGQNSQPYLTNNVSRGNNDFNKNSDNQGRDSISPRPRSTNQKNNDNDLSLHVRLNRSSNRRQPVPPRPNLRLQRRNHSQKSQFTSSSPSPGNSHINNEITIKPQIITSDSPSCVPETVIRVDERGRKIEQRQTVCQIRPRTTLNSSRSTSNLTPSRPGFRNNISPPVNTHYSEYDEYSDDFPSRSPFTPNTGFNIKKSNPTPIDIMLDTDDLEQPDNGNTPYPIIPRSPINISNQTNVPNVDPEVSLSHSISEIQDLETISDSLESDDNSQINSKPINITNSSSYFNPRSSIRRSGSRQSGSRQSGSKRSGSRRSGSGRSGSGRSNSGRSGSGQSGSGRSGSRRSGSRKNKSQTRMRTRTRPPNPYIRGKKTKHNDLTTDDIIRKIKTLIDEAIRKYPIRKPYIIDQITNILSSYTITYDSQTSSANNNSHDDSRKDNHNDAHKDSHNKAYEDAYNISHKNTNNESYNKSHDQVPTLDNSIKQHASDIEGLNTSTDVDDHHTEDDEKLLSNEPQPTIKNNNSNEDNKEDNIPFTVYKSSFTMDDFRNSLANPKNNKTNISNSQRFERKTSDIVESNNDSVNDDQHSSENSVDDDNKGITNDTMSKSNDQETNGSVDTVITISKNTPSGMILPITLSHGIINPKMNALNVSDAGISDDKINNVINKDTGKNTSNTVVINKSNKSSLSILTKPIVSSVIKKETKTINLSWKHIPGVKHGQMSNDIIKVKCPVKTNLPITIIPDNELPQMPDDIEFKFTDSSSPSKNGYAIGLMTMNTIEIDLFLHSLTSELEYNIDELTFPLILEWSR